MLTDLLNQQYKTIDCLKQEYTTLREQMCLMRQKYSADDEKLKLSVQLDSISAELVQLKDKRSVNEDTTPASRKMSTTPSQKTVFVCDLLLAVDLQRQQASTGSMREGSQYCGYRAYDRAAPAWNNCT